MADQVLEDPKGSDLGFVALGLRGQSSLPGATGLATWGEDEKNGTWTIDVIYIVNI